MKLLPHRYPFLLVDRIVDIDGDISAIGIKNVTINEPHFQGHFPGQPVMPGVLIIEAMAQTAGAICIHNRGSDTPSIVYFMTIDECQVSQAGRARRPARTPCEETEAARHDLAVRLRGAGRWCEGRPKRKSRR